jgi:hypothetical protein
MLAIVASTFVLPSSTAAQQADETTFQTSSYTPSDEPLDPQLDLTEIVIAGMVLSFGYGVLRQFQSGSAPKRDD